MSAEDLARKGWAVFPSEAASEAWCDAAQRRAETVLRDPRLSRDMLRHGRTWFVGVDVMGCDAAGAVPGGPVLSGAGVAFAATQMSDNWAGDWGRGQLSVAYPGYPRRDPGESLPNHRFRKTRAGAHLDGLLPKPPEKRRYFVEPHGVILGIALDDSTGGRSPLALWEGSHVLLLEMMRRALGTCPPDQMSDIDLTDIYAATRKTCFESCTRVDVGLAPGDMIVLHRALLHGLAPWESASPRPRRTVYFRPELANIADWLA
jgi:hypothetical protein